MLDKVKTNVGQDTGTDQKTNTQRVNDKQRRQASTRVLTALSGKQKEPNRGQGTERRPTAPRGHMTGPNEGVEMSQLEETGIIELVDEGRNSEYTANQQLSTSNRAPGHYLMKHGKSMHEQPHATSNAALAAYKKISNPTGVTIHQVKENDVVVPGVVKTLSELKKSTLGSYIKKASADAAYDSNFRGYKTGLRNPKTSIGGHSYNDSEASHHETKRNAGIARAVSKLTKEENLDELSKKTLGSYIKKAAEGGAEHMADVQHWMGKGQGASKMADRADKAYEKRRTGISKAVSRLTKEDAPAMSSGAAGDPGHVQNATDNYASQLERRKKAVKNILRRKKPVAEGNLCGHVPPEVAGVTVGIVTPEELKKNKELAQLPKKVGPGGIDQ